MITVCVSYMFNLVSLFDLISNLLLNVWMNIGLPVILFELIKKFVVAGVMFGLLSVTVMFLIWLERRICARFQSRVGPNRVGFQGFLQPVADAIKLLAKENIVPQDADRLVHFLAPPIVFTAAFTAYLCMPFGPGLIALDINLGILYIFSITTLGVMGILLAGWGSNNKYSLLGGMRSVAQIVSYEIPLILSVLGVVMLTNTLKITEIVDAQKSFFDWFIFRQPLAFIIYLIAGTAELNRTPFDIPEAESELTGGGIETANIILSLFAAYTLPIEPYWN